MTTLDVPDSPKSIRETLCAAMTAVHVSVDDDRRDEHVATLQRLADECDRHRPLGPDGKHGDRHTPTCGCEDVPAPPAEPLQVTIVLGGPDRLWFTTGNQVVEATNAHDLPNLSTRDRAVLRALCQHVTRQLEELF